MLTIENIEKMSLDDIKNLDFENLSYDEIQAFRDSSLRYYSSEQAIKLIINSIYGAFANEYFHFYNIAIAESVTLQGQDAIKFTEKMVDRYFKEFFHKDKPLHEALKVREGWEVKPIKGQVWKYTDTDSIPYNSKIRTSEGEFQIGDLYEKEFSKNGPSDTTEQGHESTTTNLKVLNWVNEKPQYSSVKRLIRHKVTKPKWKITTATGKTIEMTEDHSAIVFRNGQKIAVKPSEINLKTDKILEVYE